jgi:chemotaxis protein CheD
MSNVINIGMSQIEVSSRPGTVFIAPSLGSCIGLAIYDPESKVGGMAHIVLPDSTKITKENETPGKYADTAVPEMLKKMLSIGANKNKFIIKIAGGAQMFNLQKGSNVLNIGFRNIIAVKTALSKEGLKIVKSDTGGNKGRTFKLDVQTGFFSVKIIGQNEVEL